MASMKISIVITSVLLFYHDCYKILLQSITGHIIDVYITIITCHYSYNY